MNNHPVQLIVGLGNPGSQYAHTRHNAGEWFLSALANSHRVNLHSEKKFKADVGIISLSSHDCYLLRPHTYMNLSGESIAALANFYKIPATSILIAHDELDLAPGIIRLKKGGGHGGHNGLRSTIQCLGNADFLRLRIGIGHPGHRDLVSPFVLGKPPKEDHDLIISAIKKALPLSDKLIAGEIQSVMNELHSA